MPFELTPPNSPSSFRYFHNITHSTTPSPDPVEPLLHSNSSSTSTPPTSPPPFRYFHTPLPSPASVEAAHVQPEPVFPPPPLSATAAGLTGTQRLCEGCSPRMTAEGAYIGPIAFMRVAKLLMDQHQLRLEKLERVEAELRDRHRRLLKREADVATREAVLEELGIKSPGSDGPSEREGSDEPRSKRRRMGTEEKGSLASPRHASTESTPRRGSARKRPAPKENLDSEDGVPKRPCRRTPRKSSSRPSPPIDSSAAAHWKHGRSNGAVECHDWANGASVEEDSSSDTKRSSRQGEHQG